METKFKQGNKVKIISHPKTKYIGQVGIITNVIPVFKKREEVKELGYKGNYAIADKGEKSTGFYKVEVNGKLIPDYAPDCDLVLIEN